MTDMARAAVQRNTRALPAAMLWVGLPAYVIVVALSVRDIADSESTAVAVASYVAIGLYSLIFFWLAVQYRGDGSEPHVLHATFALVVLAVLLSVSGAQSHVYLIAASAMAGDALAPRVAGPIIVVTTAALIVSSIAHGYVGQELLTDALVVVVVGLFTMGAKQLAETNRQLVAAREEVARLAVADERLRFARDLHDLLGHTLTVIRAKSELASRVAATDTDAAAREMGDVEAIARQALTEVRETVTGSRHRNLRDELNSARSALAAAGITADVDGDALEVPPHLDGTLSWIVREGVTNVVRHSGATRCHIALGLSGDGRDLCLEVADDGHGPSNGGAATAGTGLTGVRERLAAVGGTLAAGPAPAGGFRLVATVPARATGR